MAYDISTTDMATAPGAAIQGRWVNQMGSEMTIELSPDGMLTGEYRAAVGSPAGHPHQLVGRSPHSDHPTSRPLAFVVEWEEAGSVTAWCGEYLSGPVEEIRATWLMTSEVSARDEWRSTMTGHDVFHRAR